MSRKRILVVEDNEDNRRILLYRLRKIGDFDIVETANGAEAVAAVESNPPDLIFMDLKMPVMDGWGRRVASARSTPAARSRSSRSPRRRWPAMSRRRSPTAATTTSPSPSWTRRWSARRSNACSASPPSTDHSPDAPRGASPAPRDLARDGSRCILIAHPRHVLPWSPEMEYCAAVVRISGVAACLEGALVGRGGKLMAKARVGGSWRSWRSRWGCR